MDSKTMNFILVLIGVILLLTGGQSVYLVGYVVYYSMIIGVVLILLALYGLKHGRGFF